MEPPKIPDEVLEFVARRIDSVPHLEALLLLAEDASKPWTVELIAARIYVSMERGATIMADLVRNGFVKEAEVAQTFRYEAGWDSSGLLGRVEFCYRRHLVYLASVIHAKGASAAVQEFARAFQFKSRE